MPQDKPVAVAREFVIPKAWAGNRIILRFDAVHAGTRYWLNGHELGYSENLFTPVEWDITDVARPGQTNRLDLEMKVATVSEALSYFVRLTRSITSAALTVRCGCLRCRRRMCGRCTSTRRSIRITGMGR